MSALLPLPEYRACPHCAEPILKEARLCKHCNNAVPLLIEPDAKAPSWKVWKAIGGVILAFVAWTLYYESTWSPPPPTTQAQLARPAATAPTIKPLEPGAKPKEIAQTFVENTRNETIAANEAAMLGSLRTINTAQAVYESTYNRGFAPSLADLYQADLIDSRLGSGRKGGYIFSYTPLYSALPQLIPANHVIIYQLWTRPSAYNGTAIASCFTDQTAEIHCTNEDREATSSDPVH